MHALVQSRTRRSLTILVALGLVLAGVVAARYALLPLIWHAAAMHFHGGPSGTGAMHYHGGPARVLADSLMHYFG